MNKQESLQQTLFKEIRSILPEHISLVSQVSETLGLSPDSAYRRIRGQKQLSFEELELLIKKFRVSIDALVMNYSGIVACTYDNYNKADDKVELHLNNFLQLIKNTNTFKNRKIIFEAMEVPIPSLLIVPEIFAFKKFFWYKILYNDHSFNGNTFSRKMIDKALVDFCNDAMKELVKIPSVEIWNNATIDTLVSQIRHCYIEGHFSNKKELDHLIGKLHEWVVHLKEQCELGYRNMPGTKIKGRMETYDLYCTEIIFPTNNIMIHENGSKTACLVQHDACMLQTRNQEFCNDMNDWINTCLETAKLINRKNPKDSNKFFGQLSDKINGLASEFIS